MLILITKTLFGLLILLGSGDLLVRAGVSLARLWKLSPAVIGMTILAYGTSSPELFISLKAALAGASGIALGNVIGSNIANIALVLGASSLIYPIRLHDKETLTQSYTMMAIASLAAMLAYTIGFSVVSGICLVTLAIGYTWYLIRKGRHDAEVIADIEEELPEKTYSLPVTCIILIVSIIGLVSGASLLVDGASGLALSIGVSETAIGVTVVALGGSLPELVTSVMAALKRQADMALGNIIGSNIFNIIAVLGATSIVAAPQIPTEILQIDVPVLLAVTFVLILHLKIFSGIGRVSGALFVLGYIAYCLLQFI